jgi:hypothetical protein
MSIEHHVQDAIAKIPDLSPRQKLALRNTLMAMTRGSRSARSTILVRPTRWAGGSVHTIASHVSLRANVLMLLWLSAVSGPQGNAWR